MKMRIFKHLVAFLLWNVVAGLAIFLLPAPAGLLVALLLAGWFLHGYLLRRGRAGQARRYRTLRMHPLRGAALGWTLGAVPTLFVLIWAFSEVYIGIIPVPLETRNPFGPLLSTSAGRLSVAVLAIGVAPILEEFVFRGLIQHPLERVIGPARAIGITATLFAAIHFLPWIFPLHLVLGLAFGWAVYATRSIWAGVILHAANNSFAMLGADGTTPLARPTIWETGPDLHWWAALLVLLLSIPLALYVARQLWRTGAPNRL